MLKYLNWNHVNIRKEFDTVKRDKLIQTILECEIECIDKEFLIFMIRVQNKLLYYIKEEIIHPKDCHIQDCGSVIHYF